MSILASLSLTAMLFAPVPGLAEGPTVASRVDFSAGAAGIDRIVAAAVRAVSAEQAATTPSTQQTNRRSMSTRRKVVLIAAVGVIALSFFARTGGIFDEG